MSGCVISDRARGVVGYRNNLYSRAPEAGAQRSGSAHLADLDIPSDESLHHFGPGADVDELHVETMALKLPALASQTTACVAESEL